MIKNDLQNKLNKISKTAENVGVVHTHVVL